MEVLVDTSIWIDYFRGGRKSEGLNNLIDENLIVTNDIVLTELIPFIKVKRQAKLISLLRGIKKSTLNINWEELIEYQVLALKNGANGIGIPDLIIAQNALQNDFQIYSLDKHFRLLNKILGLEFYE